MALALNNLKRVDMPLNKETKPNKKKNSTHLFKEYEITYIIKNILILWPINQYMSDPESLPKIICTVKLSLYFSLILLVHAQYFII